jgi:hypothetical protein
MAWGFNFRGTVPFVADPPGTAYVGGWPMQYPTSVLGVDVGWEANYFASGTDRDAGVDPRLAGVAQVNNDGNPATFRIDLPEAGTRLIRLALGDAIAGQATQFLQVFDDTTLIATIDGSAGTGGGMFYDATGVRRATPDAWVAANAALSITTLTTILRLKLGTPTAQTNSSTLAHLFVGDVAPSGASGAARQIYEHLLGRTRQ